METKLDSTMAWFQREIRLLQLAPEANGCEMTPEWKEQIEVFTVALACCEVAKALREVVAVGAEAT